MKMKTKIFLLSLMIFVTFSCTKTAPVPVTYQATGAISGFNLNYTDANGDLIKIQVSPQSAQDVWKLSFTSEQGSIVYLSGKYNDPNSALKLMILVNGKVYKQAANEGDTIKYLTISGVVPYDE